MASARRCAATAFGVLATGRITLAEVAQGHRDQGVIHPEAALGDCERRLESPARLLMTLEVLEHRTHVVQPERHVGVTRTEDLGP